MSQYSNNQEEQFNLTEKDFVLCSFDMKPKDTSYIIAVNIIDTNTKANICVNDCNITDNKYEYKGKCYLNCPENTSDYYYECYSKEEKCEHNCKTCLINSNSNSDFIISSICTSCYDEQFLNYGKCFNNCSNAFFYKDLDSSIKICKCDLIKCKLCSEESLLKQLCLTCNEEENFYPILNLTNNTNEFIDCYNETIPGYYFDINDPDDIKTQLLNLMTENDYRIVIAHNLKKFREEKNLSQESFAAAVGLHRTYIGSIERCERNLTLSTLFTLASFMNITIQELMTNGALHEQV